MHLTSDQIQRYRERGFLTLPALLSPAEVSVLEAAMHRVVQRDGDEVAREADGSVSIVYGIHLWDPRFATLARHPRILGPAEQLVGSRLFVHGARVNTKQTHGAVIDWHQDYGSYHFQDGMPEPRGLMVAVFLDQVTACNAPLMVIPGTQRYGAVTEVEQQDNANSPCLFRMTPERVKELIDSHGVEALMGPAGTVAFIAINLVHASSANITPLRRVLLYLILSAIDNRGETYARPPWRAARDFTPLEALDEDCLLALAERSPA